MRDASRQFPTTCRRPLRSRIPAALLLLLAVMGIGGAVLDLVVDVRQGRVLDYYISGSGARLNSSLDGMKDWLLYPMAATVAALMLHFAVGLSWGFATLAGFVGWPLVGTLVTLDDDLPRGWSNPDGTLRPDWLMAPFWGRICGGLAVSALAGALDSGILTRAGTTLAGAAVVSGGVAALLLRLPWK